AAAVLRVATKRDGGGEPPGGVDLALSAKTGFGIPSLLSRLEQIARDALESGESALITRVRHRRELETLAHHLSLVCSADEAVPVEFVAEDLRLSVRAIGRLTGQVDIDEIYDVIFREFCIGK